MISVLLTLACAFLATLLVGRRLRPRAIALRFLANFSLFAFFCLAPVHAAGLLALAGLVDTFSLWKVAASAAAILAGLGLAEALLGKPIPPGSALMGDAVERFKAIAQYHSPTGTIALAIITGLGSWLVFLVNAVISYPFGWDGLTYHLPVALTWLRDQSMAIPDFGGWPYALPSNGEVGMMLALGAGIDRLSFLFNLLSALVGGLAVFLLARRLCRVPEAAALAMAVFALLPMVQFQATSAYIDLYGSCFLMAGMAVFAYRHEFSPSLPAARPFLHAVALAGICWGIAVGTKPIFYAYGALCCAGALVIMWLERERYGRWPLLPAVVLVGCMLLPSGFWLLRALVQTGNPFYPIEVALLDSVILEGYSVDSITVGNPERGFVRSALSWFIYPWVEFKNAGYAHGTGSGLGAAWTVFVPAGLIASAVYVVRFFNEERGRTAAVLLGLFAVMIVLWAFGLRRLPRFGLPFALLACVFSAPIFEYLLATRLKLARLLFVLTFATSAVLSTFSPLHDILGRLRANAWSRAAVFEMPKMIDQLPAGTVIWNAGAEDFMTFPLAGERMTNRVISWRWPGLEVARRFIEKQDIDYIVDAFPYCCEELRTLGAKLVFEGVVEPDRAWRVWALPKEE